MTALLAEKGRIKLQAGADFTPYSANWLLHTTSYDADTEQVTDNAAVVLTGYVRQLKAPVLTVNGPQFLGATSHIFVCAADQPVALGVITNVEQPAVAFQITTIDATTGTAIECDCEVTAWTP